MITVMLRGGLGNQMFQYAAGKALSLRLGANMKLDISSFAMQAGYTPRRYELDVFHIDTPNTHSLAGKLLIKSNPLIIKYRNAYRKLGVFFDGYAIQFYPLFDEITSKNTVLFGHFRHTRYFDKYEAQIRADFRFRNPLKGQNTAMARQIANTHSVAIHIRRGDYLTNQGAIRNFATCDQHYYQRAIQHIVQIVPDVVFFVFGEDFEWVENNINFGSHPYHYIDWNKGADSYTDMQLMSLCRHNIIANSTFSWWAAWLNNNKEKTVIAPSRWFAEEIRNNLLPQFYPQGWINME